MINKTKLNFWLDAVILIAFLVTSVTGVLLWLGAGRGEWITSHAWSGVVLLAGLILHLVLHWDWVKCVVGRFFKRLSSPLRINLAADSLLWLLFSVVAVTGLVDWLLPSGRGWGRRRTLTSAVGLFSMEWHTWRDWHTWLGLAWLVIIIVHLVLHRKWIVCMLRRYWEARARGQGESCEAGAAQVSC